MSREDRPADMRVPLTASNAAGFTDPSGRVVTDSQSCPIFANSSDTPICEISGCRSLSLIEAEAYGVSVGSSAVR
jgi:hypothetical protein